MDFEGYERKGQAEYAAFAATVAAILTAAINAEEGYRLQQVKDRAKQPDSLCKKLLQRGIAATTTLEGDIKDLAGCRIIFYTNSDVTRLINSGIIHQNFDVLEVKLHHPRREAEDAAELYISNHYVVRLQTDRAALPEYIRFAGMRCEIQIQTILNHAWAEMAHDTIYKAPELGDFGGKAFGGIKTRMQKVARKYLLPAGYEFQKIASDFQRLVEGKALFDGDALEAIVEAADNNVRAEALETFAENVLPLYDDPHAVYPEVVERLLAAANRARTTPPVTIETPYGALPAKTYGDIVKAIAGILTRYRYLDVDITFDALCKLYSWAENEDDRKRLTELGKALAKHQLQVWRKHGPIAQAILVERIEKLCEGERRELENLLTEMLREVLGTEVGGSTSSSNAVTIHRGAVVASDALRAIRTKAIDLLKNQFALAESDKSHRAILQTLQAATQTPFSAEYSNALALQIMEDTRTVLEFQTQIAPNLSYELLQSTEHWVNLCYWRYVELPESMRSDPELAATRAQIEAATLAFRDKANANPDFVIYKTLVGYNAVFPPAWKDKAFRYSETKAYRAEQVDLLLASVDEASSDAWFERISHYAQTESDDAATFPTFGNFLERLAETQPAIVFGYIDRMEAPLENFLPGMLAGLMRSGAHDQARMRIDAWLDAGQHVGRVAWYLRFADPFDEALLRHALDSAIKHDDRLALRNVLVAAVSQFEKHPGTLIDGVFIPVLRHLKAAGDHSWVRMPWFSWLGSPIIRALDEEQAGIVLDALVSYPLLEDSAEDIAAAIAERWPGSVVSFIGNRLAFVQMDDSPVRYDAVPFAVHQLQAPLAAVPELMLEGSRKWYDAYPDYFTYDGGKLLASVFPNLSNGLEERLSAIAADGNPNDHAFVLSVLSDFEGKPCVYSLVRAVVAKLDPENVLLAEARSVLRESGVVCGQFGFVELYTKRKEMIEAWLDDPSENVRRFAAEYVRELEGRIAAENRSAEASLALRKLEYGEELDGGKDEG
jgi:ppGpp synthetase/RelA/SpoT-type nucleotidyltranferase